MPRDWFSFLDFHLLPQGTFERRYQDNQRHLSTLSLPRTATSSSTLSLSSAHHYARRSPSRPPGTPPPPLSSSSQQGRPSRHSIDGSSRAREVTLDMRRVRTTSADPLREGRSLTRVTSPLPRVSSSFTQISRLQWPSHRERRGRSHTRESSRPPRHRSQMRASSLHSNGRSLSQSRGLEENDRLEVPGNQDRSVSPGRSWHEGDTGHEDAHGEDTDLATDEVQSRGRTRTVRPLVATQDVQPLDNQHSPPEQQQQQQQQHEQHEQQHLATPRIPSPSAARSWYQRCSNLFSRCSSHTSFNTPALHSPPLTPLPPSSEQEEPPLLPFNLPRPPGQTDMTPRVNQRRHIDEGLNLEDSPSNTVSSSTANGDSTHSNINNDNDNDDSNTNDASSFYFDPPPLSAVNTRDETVILRTEISAAERDLLQKLEMLKRLAFVVCTLPVVLALALYYQAQELYWWLFMIPVGGVLAIVFYRMRLLRKLQELQIQSLSRTSTLQSNANLSRVTYAPMEVTIPIDDEVPLPPPTYQASLQIPPAYLSQLLRKVPSYASFSNATQQQSDPNRPALQEQSSSSLSSPTVTTMAEAQARWSQSSHTLTIGSLSDFVVQQSGPPPSRQQHQLSSNVDLGLEMVQTHQGTSSVARAVIEGRRDAGQDTEGSSASTQSVVVDMPEVSTEATSHGHERPPPFTPTTRLMASVKILAVGSANGDLATLVSKVTTIHSKHGPFDMLFCTGNFFGAETSNELVTDLLAGKFDFPMTTYFIHGSSGVPERVAQRALSSGGEVCPNLFYLGSHGVMTSAEGVKFASLSGQYDRPVYEADTNADDFDASLLKTRYTAADVESLVTSAKPKAVSARVGVDVFLSYEWPMGIMNGLASQEGGSPATAVPSVPPTTFSYPLAKLTGQLQPRYHFAAAGKTFWERPPYRNTEGAPYATRFIGLADVANPQKQRWFYAFNLVPLAKAGDEVLQASLTANTTDCPFSVAGLKRGRQAGQDNEGEQNFFWGTPQGQGQGHGQKRARGEQGQGPRSQEPPPGYLCKRCNTPGHYIKDCTAARVPPEGYVCNKCKQPGHFIADCPNHEMAEKAREERVQKKQQQQQQRTQGAATTTAPCWFCLSNPEVDKNLILSIGNEVYMTMAKGQLPSTPSNLVPGGGHVLLIAINHASNFSSVDPAARGQVDEDIAAYKQGLKKLFASKGAGLVSWELSLGGRIHHAHLQICPVPKDKEDAVEQAFMQQLPDLLLPDSRPQQTLDQQDQSATTQEGGGGEAGAETTQLAWQDHAPQDPQQGFFRVELPSGKTLVCLLPRARRANAQFGRNIVAKALGLQARSNWKSCLRLADDELADSNVFKAAFKEHDFTLA